MKRRTTLILVPGLLVLCTVPELLFVHRHLLARNPYSQPLQGFQKMSDVTTDGEHATQAGGRSGTTVWQNSNEEMFIEKKEWYDLESGISLYENTSNPSRISINFNEYASETTRESSRRYLFPVQFWEGGPNWNYLSFRRMVAYAITHNRTIVTIPFHNHHLQGWDMGWRTFGETFDIGKLSEIVSVATPEAFIEDCGSTVEFLVQFPLSGMKDFIKRYHRKQYERTRTDFEDLWGIELPDTRNNRRNKTELANQMKVADDIRCLAIHGPLLIKDLHIENETEVLKVVDKYFFRAEHVRKMGDRVRSEICGGKPYAAIHWRNRTGEWCEYNSLLLSTEKLFNDLRTLSNASRKTAMAVSEFMKSRRIDCVYIAAPPRLQEFVEHLRDAVPHLYTAEYITSRNSKKFRHLKDDNYIVSLIEQEVCSGSAVFLSCGRSNWSDLVRFERELVGNEVAYLRDIPGVPEEIYRLI